MPNGPYSSEVKGKLVTGNSSLISISSLSKRSLLPSLTVLELLLCKICLAKFALQNLSAQLLPFQTAV